MPPTFQLANQHRACLFANKLPTCLIFALSRAFTGRLAADLVSVATVYTPAGLCSTASASS
jgi:hypothetical protein